MSSWYQSGLENLSDSEDKIRLSSSFELKICYAGNKTKKKNENKKKKKRNKIRYIKNKITLKSSETKRK